MKNKVLIMLMGFFLFAHQLFAQDVSVSGNVKDEKGEALIGVSIQIKGTPTGNITDIDGNFTLSSVPANGELVFSYMGYQTQTIPVKGKSTEEIQFPDGTLIEMPPSPAARFPETAYYLKFLWESAEKSGTGFEK